MRITLEVDKAAERAGVPGIHGKGSFEDYPEYQSYQTGAITTAEYMAALALSLEVTSFDAVRIHNGLVIGPYPGTAEIIHELNAAGTVTACLSNTNELHWAHMFEEGEIPALQALEFRAASHLVGLEKPDPAFYRYLEELSGMGADEILFFDDVPANVEAARACGWAAEVIDPLEDPASHIRARLH